MLKEPAAFTHLMHTVSVKPAFTFCFALTTPVDATIYRLEPAYAVAHPATLREQLVIAPHSAKCGLVKNSANPVA